VVEGETTVTLSPGDDFRKVPREPRENLTFRRHVLDACLRSERTRDKVYAACRDDVLLWVNVFGFQFNPKDGTSGPFVTYPVQEAAVLGNKRIDFRRDRGRTYGILECVRDGRDLVIEKSRDMGMSWLSLFVMDWLARFHPNQKFLLVSRDKDMVDSSEPDSLFWKLDYINEHLPDWMKGRRERVRFFAGYAHPEGASTITGQAPTKKFGVGGRSTAVFVDEFTQIDADRELWDRTADTSDCRIANFTHTGTHTQAYRLCQSGACRKLVVHWTDHPKKNRGLYSWDAKLNRPELLDDFAGPVELKEGDNHQYPSDYPFVTTGAPTGGPFPGVRSPWYDAQCLRRQSASAVAKDLDINPEGSASQFFDALQIDQLVSSFARQPRWEGDVVHDRDTGKFVRLLARAGGPLKLWFDPGAGDALPGERFGVGGDLSNGLGKTPSVLAVAASDGERVAEYVRSDMEPKEFARVARAVCGYFKDARIAWEINGPGVNFGKELFEVLGYRNVYFREDVLDMLKRNTSDRPGWHSSPMSKRVLLENYHAALGCRQYLNRSERALRECLLYRFGKAGGPEASMQRGDDPSEAGVNHADRVIADALAWKMVEPFYKTPGETETVKASEHPGSIAGRMAMAQRQARHKSGHWWAASR
jgi:hypothetical protein